MSEFSEFLISKGVITSSQWDGLLLESSTDNEYSTRVKSDDASRARLLVEKNILSGEDLADLISEFSGFPRLDIQ